MKKFLLAGLLALVATESIQAQIASDSALYIAGDIGVQVVAPVNINSQSSCADTVGISIPTGHWISSVRLEYTTFSMASQSSVVSSILKSRLWSAQNPF